MLQRIPSGARLHLVNRLQSLLSLSDEELTARQMTGLRQPFEMSPQQAQTLAALPPDELSKLSQKTGLSPEEINRIAARVQNINAPDQSQDAAAEADQSPDVFRTWCHGMLSAIGSK